MASVSSRRKSSTSSNAAAEAAQLLQSRAGFDRITPGLLEAAEHLRSLGLITVRQSEFVCCAFTEDRDFAYSNRTCVGRLYIKASLDENANDYTCPECGRIVFPHRHGKRRFPEIRTIVVQAGVAKFIQERLAGFGDAISVVDGVRGAWRIGLGLAGVHVCVADFCDNERLLSVQWAQQNPTCYVAVNPRSLERFIDVAWVQRMMIADLVTGGSDLAEMVRALAADGGHRDLPVLATPVYSKGAHRPGPIATPVAQTTKSATLPHKAASTEEDQIVVNEDTFTVTADSKCHRFRGRSKLLFSLLARLNRRPGHQVPFSTLCEKGDVWDGAVVEDVTIRGAVTRLKKALENEGMTSLAAAISTGHYEGRPFVILNIPPRDSNSN